MWMETVLNTEARVLTLTKHDDAPPTIQEGVSVKPVPCGKCGKMTISRIESPDGQVGCLDCLKDFLLGSLVSPRLKP